MLSEGYSDIKFIGVNGYQYIENDYHCMICDNPDACSNCNEVRILPWVQDVPQIHIDSYDEQACLNNGLYWQLSDQIIHTDINQSDCLANEFTWNEDYMITYDDLNELECLEAGYTWLHDLCIDLNADVCIEDIYGCMQPVDVWGNWDIILRDLIVVNKQGIEVARLNLTYNNPDPNSTCGENYQTIKELIIGAR